MLTLGDVLALTRRSAGMFEALTLPAEVKDAIRTAAAAEGLAPPSYLRGAVADFTNEARPDEWTRLMSQLRDSEDPGSACLRVMVERRLKAAHAARKEI
ncbi:MAG TPA: hypothetical protein VIO94_06890 [Phenylobacterium sp.]